MKVEPLQSLLAAWFARLRGHLDPDLAGLSPHSQNRAGSTLPMSAQVVRWHQSLAHGKFYGCFDQSCCPTTEIVHSFLDDLSVIHCSFWQFLCESNWIGQTQIIRASVRRFAIYQNLVCIMTDTKFTECEILRRVKACPTPMHF